MNKICAILLILIISSCSPVPAFSTSIPPKVTTSQSANVDNPTATNQPSVENTESTKTGFTFLLTTPQNNEEVSISTIVLIGVVSEDAVMSVNDDIFLINAGKFKQTVSLVEGTNVLEIVVSDVHGNEIDQILTIYYEPEQE